MCGAIIVVRVVCGAIVVTVLRAFLACTGYTTVWFTGVATNHALLTALPSPATAATTTTTTTTTEQEQGQIPTLKVPA